MDRIEIKKTQERPALSGLSGPSCNLTLKESSQQFCSICEELNKLIDQRAESSIYQDKYTELKSLQKALVRSLAEYKPKSELLQNLMLGIIDYYRTTDYGSHRSITHSARWPEFKKIIEDEVKILTDSEFTGSMDRRSREASHAALKRIKYDGSNITRPWDTGTEQDLLSFHRQISAECELRKLHGTCKLLMQLDLPALPYQSNSSGTWNTVFDQFWDKMTGLYYQHKKDPAYAALEDLISIANFTRESLRTDCYPIQSLILEIADLYINMLQKPELASGINKPQLKKDLQQLRQSVYNLEPEFNEHREFKRQDFDRSGLETALAKIAGLANAITEVIRLKDQSATVEIPAAVFRGQKAFDAFFGQLATIEGSRVDTAARNSLKVAYGSEELRELSEHSHSCLLVHFQGKNPVGFALAEFHSPSLPESLQPLVEAAIAVRGNVPYSYLHLVAVKKQSGSSAYRQLMDALDSSTITNGMVYTLGWCRNNNAANIIHLKTGGEMLDGYVRITEHGESMTGVKLLRKSVRRGVQGLINIGQSQIGVMQELLAEKVS